ncbi:MAG TPA: DUF4388 domain-containing protein [Pyrinomonadaceae bacterium]|nr:DUF4388 domain-containing protein [Pyrinomonadaceae bacterium]
MSLTGELSDLSLAELIEFFCNQRKTGRLKVTYSVGEGYFYLKSGAVIHASFGDLRGVDAVHFALTQSTASFTFSAEFDAPEHSINQPWTSVVLEGLRRMDEGIVPPQPSAASLKQTPKTAPPAPTFTEVPKTAPPAAVESVSAPLPVKAQPSKKNSTDSPDDVKAFGVLLSGTDHNAFTRRRWHPALIVTAVFLLIAGVGIPWALYTRQQAARKASEPTTATVTTPTPVETPTPDETQLEVAPATESSTDTEAAELARRQREARLRERARLEQESAAKGTSAAAQPGNPAPPASNKRVTVQVTYDENGRVTAASGGDANALRIARQKRFPPGKPGSATITIPIN